jgi:tRNA(fMet)-specific endonuclease VapC
VAENLYDSSELIELRRAGEQPDGYTTVLNLIEFPKGVELEHLEILYPTKEDYDKSLIWSAQMLKRGTPVPAVDLVISAISVRLGLQLVTRDRHFKEIKSTVSELKIRTRHEKTHILAR